MIAFEVIGLPVPQGSMKVINGNIIHSQGSALAGWRSQVAIQAKRAGAKPHLEPVEMDLAFTMPRPKTVTREYPSVAPDLDKLIRAVLDALTSVAYRDDGQVVCVTARKEYGSEPGLRAEIRTKLPKNLA